MNASQSTNNGNRSILPLTLIGATIAVIILYLVWPSNVVVPDLEGLIAEDAIDLLEQNDLVPSIDSQITMQVNPGHVIPDSQSPAPGKKVGAKTKVNFSIGIAGENNIQFVAPLPDAEVKCEVLPSSIGRVYVSANINVYPNQVPLLWVKGVNPSTPVWYLQQYPFGLTKSPEKDFWSGHAQIGNQEYPPQDGSIFNFAITILDNEAYEKLISTPGEISYSTPVGRSLKAVNNVVLETVEN